MEKIRKQTVTPAGIALGVTVGAMGLISLGLIAMHLLSGYGPLLQAGLFLLLPVWVQLALLLPRAKAPEPLPEPDDQLPEKKAMARVRRHHARNRFRARYQKLRTGLTVALLAVGILALHVVFWRVRCLEKQSMNYLYPTLLAAMFVVSIVLEKWCSFVLSGADGVKAAKLRSLSSALRLSRPVYLLVMATTVVQLLGLYDARSILRILLCLLFVWETAIVSFCIAVRLIRRELDTKPELPVSLGGLGEDGNILTYLEENTGITMRSLWSLQLMKTVLPTALLGIVVVLWLSTGLVQVESYQRGALYRLGKLHPDTLKPGFHMTLPWPFDRVELYDTESVSKMAIGYVSAGEQDNIWTEAHGGEEYRLLLGGGEEIVSINLVVEYRIEDLHAYLRSSAGPEQLMQACAYEIITARTISTDLDTLLAADREAFSESFRQDLTQAIARYNTGVRVESVVLESIHPPVEIAEVYQNIISAGIDAEYERLCAQNQANQLILEAKATATDAVGTAKTDQYRLIGEANGAVTEFMASVEADGKYHSDYRFQKYINALTKAYGGARLIIAGEGVDSKNIYIGSLAQQEKVELETEPFQDDEIYEDEYEDPLD